MLFPFAPWSGTAHSVTPRFCRPISRPEISLLPVGKTNTLYTLTLLLRRPAYYTVTVLWLDMFSKKEGFKKKSWQPVSCFFVVLSLCPSPVLYYRKHTSTRVQKLQVDFNWIGIRGRWTPSTTPPFSSLSDSDAGGEAGEVAKTLRWRIVLLSCKPNCTAISTRGQILECLIHGIKKVSTELI